MSKLDELIAELCPDGVDYLKLEDVAVIDRGVRVVRNQLAKEDGYPVYQNSLTPLGYYEKSNCPKNTPFVISAGAAGDIGYSTVPFWAADDCLYIVGGETIENRYIYHALLWKQPLIYSRVRKASIPRLSRTVIEGLKIPIPPLEVQREIVRVLDNFTFLSSELSSELSARRKQYEYYSQQLLEGYKKESRRVPISALGKWQGGKTPSMQEKRFWENGSIPWISSKDMKSPVLSDTEDHITETALSEASMNLLPEESVAIVTRSGILKHTFPVAFIPFRTTVNQDIKALSVADGVSARYVSFALQAYGEDIRTKTKKQGGTVDSLDFQKVLDYQIPLPDYDVQLRIVNVLKNFEAICNDLTIGLSAEIEARQKQYEYYRDKLLTFDARA